MRQEFVISVRPGGGAKEVRLASGTLLVPKSRGLRRGDELRAFPGGLSYQVGGGWVRVTPPYSSSAHVQLGSRSLRIHLKEPVGALELSAAARLRTFHYRGGPPFGRQAVLLAVAHDSDGEDTPCGLVEVGSAPICNAARDRLLDSPFESVGASWRRWDYATRGKYCTRIAEISRVVVDPDYRGLGLSRILLQAAVDYCGDYWELGRVKPLFVEIVADMFRFHAFPLGAGFTYAGMTEGNAHRVANDLRYLISRLDAHGRRRFATEASVERMQWRYARALAFQVSRNGSDLAWVLRRLESIDRKALLRHLGMLQNVVRLPKPVFIKGLTPEADDFLRGRTGSPPVVEEHAVAVAAPQDPPAFEFRRVKVNLDYRVSSSTAAKEVCLNFGLQYQPGREEALSIHGVIPGKSVTVVHGRSGVGKTTLIRVLTGEVTVTHGQVVCNTTSRPTVPPEPDPRRAVIDLMGGSVEDSLTMLGRVGLSEPTTYLRSFQTLSEGQKERVRLALLLASPSRTWVIDRFVEGLDPLVGQIVASRFARCARRVGATVVVTTTRPKELVPAMQPDLVIGLNARGPATFHLATQPGVAG